MSQFDGGMACRVGKYVDQTMTVRKDLEAEVFLISGQSQTPGD